jgi:hypothetical protein
MRASSAAVASALALAVCPAPAAAQPLLSGLTLGPERPTLSLGPERGFRLLAAAPADEPSLDFDLLGKPPPVAVVEDGSMRWRRRMLKLHQGTGLALLALQLGATTAGQLAYLDKYPSQAPRTARYDKAHGQLALATLGTFAVTGGLALFAPSPKAKPDRGFDRLSLHKLGMATAAAGMLAQGALGLYTSRREGYLDQPRYAKAHLAIGYATLAAVGVAVGAIVF